MLSLIWDLLGLLKAKGLCPFPSGISHKSDSPLDSELL